MTNAEALEAIILMLPRLLREASGVLEEDKEVVREILEGLHEMEIPDHLKVRLRAALEQGLKGKTIIRSWEHDEV